MMHKKYRVFILFLILSVFLCGCGKHKEQPSQSPSPSAAVSTPEAVQSDSPSRDADTKEEGESGEQAKIEEKPAVDASSATSDAITPVAPASEPEKQQEEAPVHDPQPAEEPPGSVTPAAPTVTFSIFNGKGDILPVTQVEITNWDTVFDILKNQTRSRGIQMEFEGTAATAYVIGIDNLYEFDEGPESGWMFSVNGEFVNVSCGSYQVKEGDVIRWVYTTKRGENL